MLIPVHVNKSTTILQVDDIDGTRPKMNKFTTTRQTNPLVPVYQVPHVVYFPVEEPKFIRDNMVTYVKLFIRIRISKGPEPRRLLQ